MKISLGEHLTIDTSDTWRPVKMSEPMTYLFYWGICGAHTWQMYRYPFNKLWTAFHATCATLALYWPFMIMKGWAHKELGHETYGLIAALPHVTPLQVFGSLMILDKVYNWNSLTFPGGKKIFSREELNAYGINNLFVDNKFKPKVFSGLAVNIPTIAALSIAETYPTGSYWAKVISVGLAALAGKLVWFDLYRG